MRTTRIVLLTVACGLLAGPLRADKRVDDAVAKAEDQIHEGQARRGRQDHPEADLAAAAAEAFTAAARLQVQHGQGRGGRAHSAAKAVELAGAATPDVKAAAFATLSGLDLLRGTGKDAAANAQKAVEAQATPAALAALARAQVRTGDAAGAIADRRQGGRRRGLQRGRARGAGPGAAGRRQGRGGAGRVREGAGARSEDDGGARRARPARCSRRTRRPRRWPRRARRPRRARTTARRSPPSGLALLAQGNWSEAISAAQEGKFKNERNVVVLVAVGKIFEDPKSGNLQQATAAYQAASPRSTRTTRRPRSPCAPTWSGSRSTTRRSKPAARLGQAPEVQLIIGRILLRKQNYVEAVAPLEDRGRGDAQQRRGAGDVRHRARADQADRSRRWRPTRRPSRWRPPTWTTRPRTACVLAMADKYAEGDPGAGEGHDVARLQEHERLHEPRLRVPQRSRPAAGGRKAVAAYQQGARARPQERAGGARSGLGRVVRARSSTRPSPPSARRCSSSPR